MTKPMPVMISEQTRIYPLSLFRIITPYPSILFFLPRRLTSSNLCNADPVKGDQGVPTAKLLTPTNPAQSINWLRVNAPEDQGRMPQIGTYVIDTPAVKLIGDWITSIKTCPQ